MRPSAFAPRTGFNAAAVLGFTMSVHRALAAHGMGQRKSRGRLAVDLEAIAFPFQIDQPKMLGFSDPAGNREDPCRLAVKLLVTRRLSGDRSSIQINQFANQN